MTEHPLTRDLDHVLAHTDGLWNDLRGARLFVTGGTGFFGRWLLESFAWANDRYSLNAQAVVLTRAPQSFAATAPHLARHPALSFHGGDVRDFAFPAGRFTHVIHAAAPLAAVTAEAEITAIIVDGAGRVLALAESAGAADVLLVSSGAVYAPSAAPMTEDHLGDLPPTATPYAKAKRVAEDLAGGAKVRVRIARGFAFAGPYLPLDANFAIGNFIGDALADRPIVVKSDGRSVRSYLYAADLAAWLWTILLRGAPGRAYNVGSDRAITIADLARLVAKIVGSDQPVQIARSSIPGAAPHCYTPAIRRARDELSLTVMIDLEEAIVRTAAWHRARGSLFR